MFCETALKLVKESQFPGFSKLNVDLLDEIVDEVKKDVVKSADLMERLNTLKPESDDFRAQTVSTNIVLTAIKMNLRCSLVYL